MDKGYLIARLDIGKFYQDLIPGLKSTVRDEVLAKCPLHDDKHPSFSINLKTGVCYCHSCCCGGDIFWIYMKIHQCDFPTAIREIALSQGIEDPESKIPLARIPKESIPFSPNILTQEHKNTGTHSLDGGLKNHEFLSSLSSCVTEDPDLEVAIKGSFPINDTYEELEKALFSYCRHLLSIEKYKPIFEESPYAAELLDIVLKRWQEKSEDRIMGILDQETIKIIFLSMIPKVRTPIGVDLVEYAFKQSKNAKPSAQLKEKVKEKSLIKMALFCKELQKISPHRGSLFLACRSAGKYLGIHYKLANTQLRALQALGVIKEVEKGHTGYASIYRYLLED